LGKGYGEEEKISDKDPVLAKKNYPELCNSNEGSLLIKYFK